MTSSTSRRRAPVREDPGHRPARTRAHSARALRPCRTADGDAEAARVAELLDADLSSDAALEEARAALAAHPVTEAARAEAVRWAESAKEALAPPPEGIVKESLFEFADSVVSRSR